MSEHARLAIEIVAMAQKLDDVNEHRYDHNDAVMIVTRLLEGAFPDHAPSSLQVWYGPMPESNGKRNFTAILHKGDLVDGHTIARSEYPDRVRYEADRVRFLLGDLAESPDILAYDAETHSGYLMTPDGGETFTHDDAWHDLIEKDDRNSPEEYPEMCLITYNELRDYIMRAAPPVRSAAMTIEPSDWQEDPSADERWNAGLDFGQQQLCKYLGVDPDDVSWDAATEELEGDVHAVIGNIMRAKFGEDWTPSDGAIYAAVSRASVSDAEHGDLMRAVDAKLGDLAIPSTATSAEPVPVAYRWVLPGEHKWNVTVYHPRHHTAQTPAKIEPLYATHPSSGNADAVRGDLIRRLSDLQDHYSTSGQLGADNSRIFTECIAALSSAPVAGEWQDISTAPKDRDILAVRIEWWEPENGNHRWIHGNIRQTKWDAERQRFGFDHEKQPTHWTEVPAIPALPIPRNDRGGPQS